MSKALSKEKEKEFEELSLFLEYFASNVWGIDRDDEVHPSNVLAQSAETFSKSRMLQGLIQAINDVIESTCDFDAAAVIQLDEDLAAKDIVTLSSLRRKYWSKYRNVIKRGKIKNETEYYLVNGLLCDLSSQISEQERNDLSRMVASYEQGA